MAHLANHQEILCIELDDTVDSSSPCLRDHRTTGTQELSKLPNRMARTRFHATANAFNSGIENRVLFPFDRFEKAAISVLVTPGGGSWWDDKGCVQ